MGKQGCCSIFHFKEENTRFALLAVVMIIYLLIGASVFMVLEKDTEVLRRTNYYNGLERFRKQYPSVNISDLMVLLDLHADAYTAGYLDEKRPRWDFSGAFYFVCTVVSTIGFGMTTPRTTSGKVALIIYGFIGCAGAILFFNMFLERTITLLSVMLRVVHTKRQKKVSSSYENGMYPGRRASTPDEDSSEDGWKPSVYGIQLILFIAAALIAFGASAMYHVVEKWEFFDAVYFCFVTFSTIGFGDYVISQKESYPFNFLYRTANFVLLALGCCCVYSFFNITTLLIRMQLDKLIKLLNFNCVCLQRSPKNSKSGSSARTRRNAMIMALKKTSPHKVNAVNSTRSVSSDDSDDISDSDKGCNKPCFNRGDMLAMQKTLQEQNQVSFRDGVGPLAIVSKKFGRADDV